MWIGALCKIFEAAFFSFKLRVYAMNDKPLSNIVRSFGLLNTHKKKLLLKTDKVPVKYAQQQLRRNKHNIPNNKVSINMISVIDFFSRKHLMSQSSRYLLERETSMRVVQYFSVNGTKYLLPKINHLLVIKKYEHNVFTLEAGRKVNPG